MNVHGKDNKPSEEDDHSTGENSDGGLQIVLESPKTLLKTKRRNTTVLDKTDKEIIACVEKDLERNLEQKAAKANLTATHVKNILKHVVTNEDVWALLRHAENPNDEPITTYEPKCTRAKAKELLSGQQQTVIIPWTASPNVSSETQLLVSQELDEDSSEDDEYVPKKLQAIQASKDSDQKIQNKKIEEANIALRTRSKLSLSHTPLETLEESFIPPDITTDMYDMNCDDDVWKDFLKTFTKPLDEVVKAVEDEDHDPEYNILADEEIDEVDVEELRADRAVTVSRKEFNNLMNELFEYADIYDSNNLNDQTQLQEENLTLQNLENSAIVDAEEDDVAIKKTQIPTLVQQLRQHVQMLTQNFILTYGHPELDENASSLKQSLLNLRKLGEDKEVSIIKTIVNLEPAILLVDGWESFYNSDSSIVKEMKLFTDRVIVESIRAKSLGTDYVCTFPPLLMETIINSEVFLYPSLLPRIPFRSFNITNSSYYYFCNSENNLIAIYLEQLIPMYKSEHNDNLIKMNIYRIIQANVMPHIGLAKLANHVARKKNDQSEENPIKYYFRTQKAPPTVHYVGSLNDILAPINNDFNFLPYQWKEYILSKHKPDEKTNIVDTVNNSTVVITTPITIISSAQNHRVTGNLSKPIYLGKKILPKGPLSPLILSGPKRRKRRVYKKPCPSSYKDLVQEALAGEVSEIHENVISSNEVQNLGDDKMFPDMPSLGATPIKNNHTSTSKETERNEAESSSAEQTLTFKNVTSCGHQYYKPQAVTKVKRNFECIADFSEATASTSSEKDNPDDINELMRASSTVKYIPKKEPSGAEKKRAKLRREFVSNLAMASPEHEDVEKQRQESFAGAYFDKLSQTLEPNDWTNLLEVFNRYDYETRDFLEFYEDVQNILGVKYQELAEQFLLFLTKLQAYKIGKLMPYLRINNMHLFLKKVQIYFKDQPTQMKKIMKCLTDMSADSGGNMEAVKAQMLPLLKGNSALNDLFLQLFENERPPSLLAEGPSEVMDIAKELSRQTDEEIYETIVVPDCEDPYGGPTCICVCHNEENLQLKTRATHCRKCGLKFIQGKVFIQSGKSLRPAVVSFLTNPEKDHTKRLSASQRKRSDSSPSKQASPNKETHTLDELRNSNESEDDGDGNKKKRIRKTQIKRKTKHRINGNVVKDPGKTNNKRNKALAPKSGKISIKKARTKKNTAKKETDVKTEPTGGQKRTAEESIEIEFNEPAEFVELKVSSDHSGESESEYLESSQDITNTDSNNSSDSSICSQKDSTTWTRDEDKIILQTVNNEDKSIEERFKQISGVLQNRTISQIRNRFHKLMTLLHKMASTK